MASGMLHRGDDVYVGHENDDSYLLYLSGHAGISELRIGRDVQAEDDGMGGLVLSSPHSPVRLFAGPTAMFAHTDGRQVPQLPIIRRLLADPSQPQVVFAE